MSFLIDFLTARAMRDNPAFAHQQMLEEQRKYALEQAMQLAKYANAVVGTPAQRVPTPLLNAGQMVGGSGLMGAPDLSNIQRSILEQNRQMMQTANPTLLQAALENMSEYQKSLMGTQKDISVNKFKGTDLPFEEYQNMSAEERKIFDAYKGHNQPGVQINMGDGRIKGSWLTKEEKIAGGLDPNQPFTWGADGSPKLIEQNKTSDTSAETGAKRDMIGYLSDSIENLRKKGVSVNNLTGVIDKARASGGPIGGTVASITSALGYTPQSGVNEMLNNINAMQNMAVQLITGAAIGGTSEETRILGQLPREGQPDDVFDTNVKATKENFRMLQSLIDKRQGKASEVENAALPPGWKLLPDGRAQDPSGKIWRRKK